MNVDAPEECLKSGCKRDRIDGSCMCFHHTMAGANPLGPDDEWTCPCGGWDEECGHFDDEYDSRGKEEEPLWY